MPLIQSKSKKAFNKNVGTEMNAGKPQKQSLAIAFSVQRKNKRKKMAQGGGLEDETPHTGKDEAEMLRMKADKKAYAKGGSVQEDGMDESKPHSGKGATDAFRKAADRKAFAKGGSLEDMEESEEKDLMKSASPGPYGAEPKKGYDKKQSHIQSDGLDEEHPHTGETEADMYRRHAEEMAYFEGGKVEDFDGDEESEDEHPENMVEAIMRKKKKAFSEDEGNEDLDMSHEHDEDDSMAARIAKKMASKKKYAKGGMVTEHADEGPATDQSYNIKAKKYWQEEGSSSYKGQPKDSNEHGDEEEDESENMHDSDIVSRIRNLIKKRGY